MNRDEQIIGSLPGDQTMMWELHSAGGSNGCAGLAPPANLRTCLPAF
jgi:hypothetical protein